MEQTVDKRARVREERKIHFRAAGSGVSVVFFTLIVKMASLRERHGEDLSPFFRDSAVPWETDGALCATASMACEFADIIELLEGSGLQCREAPVDFYVVEEGMGGSEFAFPAHCLTMDDGEIDFYCESDREYACLKAEQGRPNTEDSRRVS